ncbi:mitochondrial outer membrane protein porin 5-like [Populus alba x Populus x berolinensis]|nr:mitochondrial outer membrane protein porin 5-like [Populus alba x Populus x berolinensis]
MVCCFSTFVDIVSYKINLYFSISNINGTGLICKQSKAAVTAEYNLEDTHATIKVDVNPELPVQFQILHKVQYFHKRAALAMTLPLLRSPLVRLSATVGTEHLAFGMKTIYNTSSRQFLMSDAGISMKSLNCDGSIVLENNGDFLRASYIHYFDHERKLAAVAVIGRALSRKENSFLVEGSWIVDDLTTIKGRFDSRGKLAATLRYKIKPKSFFTISGEFEPKALDKTPEIRLGLSLVI